MDECIFCKIIKREIPSKIVYEDEEVVGFEDVHPQAPTHILLVPRTHVATLNDVDAEHQSLLGALMLAGVAVAKDRKISSSGYRLVINTNRGAGQSVFHVHLHLLGGRSMAWPPG
ncbi:MAG TPA: histidine triad nucleotide-binding protein [Acidobacteriota bacterium]